MSFTARIWRCTNCNCKCNKSDAAPLQLFSSQLLHFTSFRTLCCFSPIHTPRYQITHTYICVRTYVCVFLICTLFELLVLLLLLVDRSSRQRWKTTDNRLVCPSPLWIHSFIYYSIVGRLPKPIFCSVSIQSNPPSILHTQAHLIFFVTITTTSFLGCQPHIPSARRLCVCPQFSRLFFAFLRFQFALYISFSFILDQQQTNSFIHSLNRWTVKNIIIF